VLLLESEGFRGELSFPLFVGKRAAHGKNNYPELNLKYLASKFESSTPSGGGLSKSL
jgi:hypothetical protein